MKQPQLGFFSEMSSHAYFLEYRLVLDEIERVKETLTQLYQTDAKVYTQLCFGEEAWLVLAGWSPEGLVVFNGIDGQEGHYAPSTQSDLLLRIHGHNQSDVFDQAMLAHSLLSEVAELSLEQACFDYHHSMDLIGFEDGTANPKTDELKRQAALIPEGYLGEGGSLVLSQKWVHDLKKWQQIPVSCQEKVVGRTKDSNEELEGDMMPVDSHVARTDLKIDGVAMKIYRCSMPFGSIIENGLYFLAFACEQIRFTAQLESMYGLSEDGEVDQLLNYSQAVSGGYWFSPSIEDLESVLNLK